MAWAVAATWCAPVRVIAAWPEAPLAPLLLPYPRRPRRRPHCRPVRPSCAPRSRPHVIEDDALRAAPEERPCRRYVRHPHSGRGLAQLHRAGRRAAADGVGQRAGRPGAAARVGVAGAAVAADFADCSRWGWRPIARGRRCPSRRRLPRRRYRSEAAALPAPRISSGVGTRMDWRRKRLPLPQPAPPVAAPRPVVAMRHCRRAGGTAEAASRGRIDVEDGGGGERDRGGCVRVAPCPPLRRHCRPSQAAAAIAALAAGATAVASAALTASTPLPALFRPPGPTAPPGVPF